MRKLKTTTTQKNTLHHARRTIELGSWRALDKSEKEEMYQLERIRYCLQQITRTPYEIDHLIPVSRGGENHPCNMVITTKEFNRRKGNKRLPFAVEEWFMNTSPVA